ncbi:MAG: Calx-beta domain-containing protein [Nocardioides sp.]
MKYRTTMAPSPAGGRNRLRRQLISLFAAVLVLGFFSPMQAARAAAAPGALLVRDAGVVEGDSSTVAVRIALVRRVDHRVSVSYRTVPKSARSGVDFVAVSGRVVIPAGAKGRTVRVPVIDDALDESTEHFRVRIYDPVGASIVDPVGRVSIFDDDPTPTMSVGDVSITEPTSGSSTLSFPVSISAPSGRTISVSYVVTAGTATSGSDYVASPSTGQLVLPAGTTSGVIPVTVLSDNVLESTETLQVTLYSPVHVTVIDGSAVGTILDSTAPRLSVADVSVNEGDPARFVVSLTKPAPQTVTFRYSTSNGTASSSDYSGANNVSATISAGASSTTLTVNTTEDTTVESNETFNLTLSSIVNAVVTDGTAQATIVDDDAKPNISISDDTVTEGQEASFTVSLSKASTSPVTFTFATVDGTAVAGEDYTSTSNTRTIPAGQTSTTIKVKTTDDGLDENTETFHVLLSNVVNANATDGDGLGTIADNDPTPTLSIVDVSQHENSSPTMTFTVTLSAVSGRTVTVNYATSNGTATTADGDYTAKSGTLTIPAGTVSATFTVSIDQDTKVEPDETFNVHLSNPVNADFANANADDATGTIENDDI